MNRVLLQYLLPLLLPTLLYLLWWGTIGRRKATVSGGGATLSQGPWFWLILGGGLLLAASLVYTALVAGVPTGAGSEERYVPPQLKDGRVVPGHFE
jgi:ABC-type Na+ efflux pump permease subunit